jgi:thiazole synthase ThiGH ThiG subunit
MPLPFVTPDMALAKPVVDAEGRILAGAGTRLDERMLRLLRKQAIQTVVVDAPEGTVGWETVQPLSEELAALGTRFDATARSEALDVLREAVARHLARRAGRLANDAEPDR